jgi:diketogulonate reductase-like aldo/keto reductase
MAVHPLCLQAQNQWANEKRLRCIPANENSIAGAKVLERWHIRRDFVVISSAANPKRKTFEMQKNSKSRNKLSGPSILE